MAAPFSFLMDRKENPQLLMKMMVAKSVISSIIVFSDSRRILSEVRMMKQMPQSLRQKARLKLDYLKLSLKSKLASYNEKTYLLMSFLLIIFESLLLNI